MRNDGAGIAASGSSSFEKKVMELVDVISGFETGRAVFVAIKAEGAVLVTPYPEKDFNAQAIGEPLLGRVARVEFSPTTFDSMISVGGVKMVNAHSILMRGMEADEVLLHELMHAARFLGDQFAQKKLTGKMAPYENEEEYFAILVANIYMSEKGKAAAYLRQSHGLEPISTTGGPSESEKFLYEDDNYRLVEKFCRQHPKVSKMLAKVPAKFNPIKAYYTAGTVTIKDNYTISIPHRISQRDTLPRLTDEYLIGILQPRYRAGDVAGYGARVKKLAEVFSKLRSMEAVPLLMRLELRPKGDKVAMYFHDHLHTQSRMLLINIVRSRVGI